MAFDLDDEELEYTRKLNGLDKVEIIKKSDINNLLREYKNLKEIELEHQKENGQLRTKLNCTEQQLNSLKSKIDEEIKQLEKCLADPLCNQMVYDEINILKKILNKGEN